MNTKSIIASISLLVATGAAFAAPVDQSEAAQEQAFLSQTSSTLTRAQVRADTIAAIKIGAVEHNEAYDDVAYLAPRAKTAAVKAQLAAKAAKGGSVQ
jgi:hypothetical protein